MRMRKNINKRICGNESFGKATECAAPLERLPAPSAWKEGRSLLRGTGRPPRPHQVQSARQLCAWQRLGRSPHPSSSHSLSSPAAAPSDRARGSRRFPSARRTGGARLERLSSFSASPFELAPSRAEPVTSARQGRARGRGFRDPVELGGLADSRGPQNRGRVASASGGREAEATCAGNEARAHSF